MLLLIPAPRWSVLLQDFFGYGDRGHRAWPAGVKRQVRNGFDQLVLRHAVLAREGEVGSKLVGAVHRDERADSHQAAIPRGQSRTRPHIPKQHVVSELGEFGGDVAEQFLGLCGLHCSMLLFLMGTVVLLIAYLLHPVDHLAVEFLLDRDMGQGGGGRCAMPMLLARRAPNYVARPDDLDRAAPALHKTAAARDDERLTERMRVPITPCAWLERDVGAARACRTGCLEQLVDAHRAGEIFGRSSGRWLRTVAFDVHLQSPVFDWRSDRSATTDNVASAAPSD